MKRPLVEIREAYLAWVTGCTVNDVPRVPAAPHEFEWSAFLQGYMFGQMSDDDFTAVVERLQLERAAESAAPTSHSASQVDGSPNA